ncbi:DUF3365 domain-containing protein [Tamlana haliotis]|uniref:DUF3365 domain-containing protein n=1 Tax=Pseudotamlana haliotis TaxID=2614804 RepID=A0A6N6MQ54_9FLAO|nr:DUF3365 domain-containing protein [Tamlana haliotis]KAB1071375.1 DUF3365 domain-containing protein [Tamlana haliotis]
MKKGCILLIVPFFIFNCNQSKKKENVTDYKKEQSIAHPGKQLMETNCYTCHSPTASKSNKIGPPMSAIKNHYISPSTTKEEFIEDMIAWINNPNVEDSKMPGAVEQFGLMPKSAYPDETIKQIASYMFDNDIDKPEGFSEKNRNKNSETSSGQSAIEKLPYGERGLKYALSTKTVLGKNLIGTIQKEGTLEALAFCNEAAYPLTDSMSVVHHATIKRVSDKPRNPDNQANAEELNHIKTFKNTIKNQGEPQPILEETSKKVNVYYPIVTNSMCLQCHGNPGQNIEQQTYKKLKALYPKDEAIGYNTNQVRGIWSITFDK